MWKGNSSPIGSEQLQTLIDFNSNLWMFADASEADASADESAEPVPEEDESEAPEAEESDPEDTVTGEPGSNEPG